MKMLIRIAKWISRIVAIALLLFLVNLAAYRLRGASDAQEAALAQMAQEFASPVLADNAYALAWLMRYDVADGEIETITAAHLRLAATLIWLRETRDDPGELVERFASRPAHLRSGERASGISEDGRSIWVDNLHARHSARFSLALPVAVGE